ncbi:MAG: hypothetical protein MZV70_18255 [Desulfobacterales bacterium]|nr:hypothetical protein [Desulfobacterales bacterium]
MDPAEARVLPTRPSSPAPSPAFCPASRIVGAGNCICCLWIVGGAALAVKLLARRLGRRPDLGRRGHRRRPDRDHGRRRRRRRRHPACGRSTWSWPRRVLDKAAEFGGDMPAESGRSSSTAARRILSPGWFLLGLFLSAAVFAVIGVLGGIIGVSALREEAPQASPPGSRPRTPRGPPDAA